MKFLYQNFTLDKSVVSSIVFVYIWEVCSVEMDAEWRIAAGNRVNGALAALLRRRNVSTPARLAVHNAVLVPTLLYCSQTWVLHKKYERKINTVEMRSLRRICGVSLADPIRNKERR